MAIDREKILTIAQRFILKGQSDRAIKEYQKLIEASPNDKRLHLKLGDLYLKNGDHEKAIKQYQQVADLFASEELNSQAISIYKKILAIDPKRMDAHRQIARLYLKEGLIANARTHYQSILNMRPGDHEASRALEDLVDQSSTPRERNPLPLSPAPSRLSASASSPSSAESEGQERHMAPAELAPPTPDKEAETHYHLGIAYKQMELLDYAISEFEAAASDPALRVDCFVMLGECFMQKGDYDRSIRFYEEALKDRGVSNGKRARVHVSLGEAYEAQGMLREALQSFEVGLRLDPSLQGVKERIEHLQGQVKAV